MDADRPIATPSPRLQFSIVGWMTVVWVIGAMLALRWAASGAFVAVWTGVVLAFTRVWWTHVWLRRTDPAILNLRLRQAEACFRLAYGMEKLPAPGALAETLTSQAALEDAERRLVDTLTVQEAYLADYHPQLAATLNELAQIRQMLGRADEARSVSQRAAALPQLQLPGDQTAWKLLQQALNSFRSHNFAEAQGILFRALSMLEGTLDHSSPAYEVALSQLAINEICLGQYRAAEGHSRWRAAIVEE